MKSVTEHKWSLYVDGSCLGNQNVDENTPAAWSVVVESATLSHSEHEEVIRVVVDHTAGRVPVIAGAGSNNTAEALRLMQFAKDVGAIKTSCERICW